MITFIKEDENKVKTTILRSAFLQGIDPKQSTCLLPMPGNYAGGNVEVEVFWHHDKQAGFAASIEISGALLEEGNNISVDDLDFGEPVDIADSGDPGYLIKSVGGLTIGNGLCGANDTILFRLIKSDPDICIESLGLTYKKVN